MANVPTPCVVAAKSMSTLYAPCGTESNHDALMRFALELHGVNPPTTPEMREFREFCDKRGIDVTYASLFSPNDIS